MILCFFFLKHQINTVVINSIIFVKDNLSFIYFSRRESNAKTVSIKKYDNGVIS